MVNEDLKVRLDKFLWAIRIYKTRSQAGNAIDSGKVKMNGNSLKASHIVKREEEYSINTKEKKWQIKVIDVLEKRMKAIDVAPFFKDITPDEELERMKMKSSSFYNPGNKYDDKSGRPTKKNRRMLDGITEEGI
ncbi:heat-shock protein Hsp15 [Bacteroidota bacterium]|nr:heat-shock protein Hsp15 [Bacteroidota bacterium]